MDDAADARNDKVGDTNGYHTPGNVDGVFGTGQEDNRPLDSGVDFATAASYPVLVSDARVSTDALESRVSFLENKLSMLEAALDASKLKAMNWESTATALQKQNFEMEEELQRLHSVPYVVEGGRTDDVRTQLEIVELHKKLQIEMRAKIKIRTDLRKAEAKI